MQDGMTRRPLIAAGTLLGIGMGGFVDGIVFHQILQIHNMLSNWVPKNTIPNFEINMVWDGIFHAFCWTMVAAGLAMLWTAVTRPDVPKSGRSYFGSLMLGWGIFNLVEGIIDHEILGVHHVYQNGNHFLWDMVFLAFGVMLIGVGWAMIRVARSDGEGYAPTPT